MNSRRRHGKKKKKSFIKSLKIYSAIFFGCFLLAGIISLVTGKIPEMINNTVSNAISNQISKQVGDIGIEGLGGGAAKDILKELGASGGQSGGKKNSGVDLKKMDKSTIQGLMKKYGE